MGVYTINTTTGEETLCTQFHEILSLGNPFIGVSGTDRDGKCSGKI